MQRITRFLTLVILIVAMLYAVCLVSAADVSVTTAKAEDIIVRSANNDNLAFDIKAYKANEQTVYLFMPADVDLSKLIITFNNVSKVLDMTTEKTVHLADGEFTLCAMQTNLPVINMTIDESQGTIAAMNKDPEHDTKCFGTFYLDVPSELAQKNGWQEYYTDPASEIKGRGNATWSLDKKAYQIKLDKKQSILEMGKDKTWIILANHGDRSLIRNKLAYDFAKDMDMEFALDCEFVDVYFNGEYQGNYLLTEKVELGKERVNIYDLEEKDENPDADRVTGGYLIEYDRLAESEITWTVGPETGRLITIKSPEEANDEQRAYITGFIGNMEKSIYADDGKSPEGKHYSEYMDVDSFIKLYWINEIFKNGDFFYGSTFMYKDVGENEKLYSGPAWDFDITLANACSNAGAGTPARQANLASPIGWWVRTVADGFTKRLFAHEDFRLRNKEIYDTIVRELLLNMSQRADEYAEYIRKSADMNFVRWNVLLQDHQWETPNKSVTYDGEIDFVKTYLSRRAEWIDKTMNSDMATSDLGTEYNPIKISTALDLKKMRDEVNAGDCQMGCYFRQTADIDLAGEEFAPIGMNAEGFMGNYDGCGYSIKNLKITTESVNDSTVSAGLFARVSGGEIKNVNIISGVIDVVACDVGSVAGRMNGAKIYNCTNSADVTNRADSNLQMVGGIVGHMVSGTQNYLVNCINYGNVNAPNAIFASCRGVGGIIGHASTGAVAVAVVNYGEVTCSFAPDGFVGAVIGELSGRRTRITHAYWLSREGDRVGGQGQQQRTQTEGGRNMNVFSGSALDAKVLNSKEFAHEMNLQLISISRTGGLDYRLLKMWETGTNAIKLTDDFATLDTLPKYKPEWIMSNRSTANKWIRNTSGAKAQYEEKYITMAPENNDPITFVSLDINERFLAEEYPFVAVKMRVVSTVDEGGFFFGTDEFPGPVAEAYSQFEVYNDGRWHDYIIDMSQYEHDRWHGTVNVFRLDPINGEDTEAKITIERIGIFKTQQEAQAFLDESDMISQVLRAENQTVYLSENAFLTKGNKKGFTMKDASLPDASQKHEKAQIVVMYMDNGGNESVVPMCYTDDNAYTSYVANKPGNYKLAYSHKEYDDISGHWGEEYVDFTSARGLFGGTSPTEFSPDEIMTRGMFVTVLGRMHGVDSWAYADGLVPFDDVKLDEYYTPYVRWAAENGILNTLSERSFYADEPITRKDMVVMIYRYINRYSYGIKRVVKAIEFNDISVVEPEAQLAIQIAQRCGLVNGKGASRFDPLGSSTRAEVSTVMTRLIKAILMVE